MNSPPNTGAGPAPRAQPLEDTPAPERKALESIDDLIENHQAKDIPNPEFVEELPDQVEVDPIDIDSVADQLAPIDPDAADRVAEGLPAQLPGPKPVPAEEPPAEAPPEEPPENAMIRLLRDELASSKKVQEAQAALLDQQKAQAPPEQQASEVAAAQRRDHFNALTQYYQFGVPKEISEGLRSEDPDVVGKALGAMLSTVAAATHQTIMDEVAGPFAKSLRDNIRQGTDQAQAQAAHNEKVGTDFYEKYPQLAGMKEYVRIIAAQVLDKTKATEWSDGLRDVIAQAVVASLDAYKAHPAATPAAEPGPKAVPAAAPTAQPYASGGSSARRSTTKPGPNSKEAILALL